MKFAEIPVHTAVKTHLLRMVRGGKLPHALLISGPEGSGKLSLARALAQYMQCACPGETDSCGECPSCKQHRSLNHADMHYVFPVIKKKSEHLLVSDDYLAEWREFLHGRVFSSWQGWLDTLDAGNSRPAIYVEEAASILHTAGMSAYTSPVKVVLIWLPEKISVEAANKLLKIIEEPWEDTRFILVSNDASAILPTIFSRTQRVNVPRLSDAEVVSLLAGSYAVDQGEATAIARMARGNACAAIAALDTRGEAGEFASLFRDVMRKAYLKDVRALRELGDRMAAMGREKNCRMLEYFTSQVRENFIYNLHQPQLSFLSADEAQFSARFSPFVNTANVEGILSDFDAAHTDIARNANAKIVMFDTLLRLIVHLIKKP